MRPFARCMEHEARNYKWNGGGQLTGLIRDRRCPSAADLVLGRGGGKIMRTYWPRIKQKRGPDTAPISRHGIEVPPNRIYQLTAGKRSITADTALRLGRYFGMPADFWMNLQSAYELDLARSQNGKAIQRIPQRGRVPAPRSLPDALPAFGNLPLDGKR